jgi:hypothetical protein
MVVVISVGKQDHPQNEDEAYKEEVRGGVALLAHQISEEV